MNDRSEDGGIGELFDRVYMLEGQVNGYYEGGDTKINFDADNLSFVERFEVHEMILDTIVSVVSSIPGYGSKLAVELERVRAGLAESYWPPLAVALAARYADRSRLETAQPPSGVKPQ